jgi:tripartite-type tricarboxylate transporter receptor subunit TctC
MIAGIAGARAQSFPSKQVTMIVPFPAGGGSDILARVVAERMRSLGQPVIVENVGGAGGTIGTARASRARRRTATPSASPMDLACRFRRAVSDDVRSAEGSDAGRAAHHGEAVAGRPRRSAAQHLKELIAWLKANPNKATAATIGAGSGTQLCLIYLQQNTGTKFQLVPYRGTAPIFTDLLAGHVDLTCPEAGQTLALYRSGKIKAYAVMDETRWFAAPMCRPPTRPARRAAHDVLVRLVGAGRTPRTSSPSSTPRWSIRLTIRACGRGSPKRAVIPTREQLTPEARRAPQGRDRSGGR